MEWTAGNWQTAFFLSASYTNFSIRYGDGCEPVNYINIFSFGHSSNVSEGLTFAREEWKDSRRKKRENKGRIIPLDDPARRIEIEENDVNF
jgi:hypothetical protein